MKNFSLVASSTLILTARQSVHASGTLLVFTNFSNLVSLFDLGFKPFGCLAPGDESLEDEELACCFVNINLDSKQSVQARRTLLVLTNLVSLFDLEFRQL